MIQVADDTTNRKSSHTTSNNKNPCSNVFHTFRIETLVESKPPGRFEKVGLWGSVRDRHFDVGMQNMRKTQVLYSV